jgi:predicted polyphosphate/ATP-dependent NAD kinase
LDNPEIYSGKALVMGPGSTCLAIKQALGLNGALLGCDVLLPSGEVMENATSADLLNLASQHTLHVLVSFTRHQGFLLGRGNQQLSAEVLHTLRWKEDVTILGSRTKLATLDQRPMLVDTGDAMLDQQLSGLVSVLTGYDDFLLYRVSSTLLPDS